MSPKSSNAGPCYLWQPSVVGIGDGFEQLLNTPAPDRCDDPELGQVCANGIDDRRLLANEQMPCAVECQTVGTKRMLGLVTASQIASASAASF